MLPILNRSLAVLTPREPFRAWLRERMEDDPDGVDEDLLERAGLEDRTAFLLPDYEDAAEAYEILDRFAPLLFEITLSEWYGDESTWPEARDLTTLLEWFDLELMSMVLDTWDHPLEAE